MDKFKLTHKKFEELLRHMLANNFITANKNGKICKWANNEIRSLLSFFLPDDNISAKIASSKEDGIEAIFAMMAYYALYTKTHNGQEPFNLMDYVDEKVEEGARYGWRGRPFNIVIGKKIQGNCVEVKIIYCNTNAGGFKLNEEKTITFNFDPLNCKEFEQVAHEFANIFGYKEFEFPCSHFEMIQKIEKELETQKKELEALKNIYNA